MGRTLTLPLSFKRVAQSFTDRRTDYEQTLAQINQTFIYKLPPRTTAKGYRCVLVRACVRACARCAFDVARSFPDRETFFDVFLYVLLQRCRLECVCAAVDWTVESDEQGRQMLCFVARRNERCEARRVSFGCVAILHRTDEHCASTHAHTHTHANARTHGHTHTQQRIYRRVVCVVSCGRHSC